MMLPATPGATPSAGFVTFDKATPGDIKRIRSTKSAPAIDMLAQWAAYSTDETGIALIDATTVVREDRDGVIVDPETYVGTVVPLPVLAALTSMAADGSEVTIIDSVPAGTRVRVDAGSGVYEAAGPLILQAHEPHIFRIRILPPRDAALAEMEFEVVAS